MSQSGNGVDGTIPGPDSFAHGLCIRLAESVGASTICSSSYFLGTCEVALAEKLLKLASHLAFPCLVTALKMPLFLLEGALEGPSFWDLVVGDMRPDLLWWLE